MARALFVVLTVFVLATQWSPALAGDNGGSKCAACTLLNALVGQTMQLQNITAKPALDLFCSYTPFPLDLACADLLKNEISIELLDQGESPDTICLTMKACTNETGQVCRLFPRSKGHGTETDAEVLERVERYTEKFKHVKVSKFDICKYLPGVCAVENHLPYYDDDGDRFSTHNELRGGYFRGRDCDDQDARIFPGRDSLDGVVDANCNGILGVDNSTGLTYEEQWCKGTGAMGVASLGDSATAHFRLPPMWFNASELSSANFAQLFTVLQDEMDWPMLSWSTGHFSASQFHPDISGRMVSLYSKMVERNRCNHRDYQNLGVNGARVSNLVDFADLLNRNASEEVKPLLLIMSMVGNDVCDGHHTFSDMTTPAEYFRRVKRAVLDADSFLPNGSHIVLVPLVDGRILFNSMHDRIHPIGWTNQDVTYVNFYDYLNCLHVNPCWGWMNSNETVRNMTSERAYALSQQLPLVVNATAGELKNVQVHYLGNIYMDALNLWDGPMWELIEPVDGFHPSQLANSLIGEHLFNVIEAAGILAPPNPNNDAIQAMFGSQGGY